MLTSGYEMAMSVWQWRQIQPLDGELERVVSGTISKLDHTSTAGPYIPRITPRGIEIQPAAYAIVKIHIGVDNPLAILPLRTGQDLAERRDDGRPAPRHNLEFLGRRSGRAPYPRLRAGRCTRRAG